MNALEGRPIEILLVEDTPTDVRLTVEVFKRAKVANHMTVASDGLEALEFLHRQGQYANAPRPDLILLDLKLPVMDGHEVLAAIKAAPDLRSIPVIVLTCSTAESDALRAYNQHAACYISKPVEFEEFVKVISSIESFWFSVVVLPSHTNAIQITTG